VEYWDKQTTDLDGILGGYGRVHPCDIDTSRNMIERFKGEISGFNTAIDCGAGWGRITKDVLVPRFKAVDLLEPAPAQIEKAREHVPEARNFIM
jgi:protein N-terminal methyltransferase